MAQGGNLRQDNVAVTRAPGAAAGTPSQTTSADRGHTTETEIETETDTETRRLREQIEDTRAQMSDTVNALQDRLQPDRLVRDARGAIRDAVAQRARSAAETAIELGHRVTDRAIHSAEAVRDRAEENPWIASVVAVGSAAGLAWLLSRSTGVRNTRSDMTDGWTDSGVFPDRDRRIDAEPNGHTRSHAGAPLALAAATGLVYWMTRSPKASDAAEPIASRATSFASQAADYATEVSAMMDDRASDARETIDRWLKDNPLGLGAAAFALGVIAGLALPASANEERLMQSAVHSLIDSFASGPSAFGGSHRTSH